MSEEIKYQKRIRYLITGGAGAIGSYIVNKLSENQNNVIDVLDNFDSGDEININSASNINIHEGSILDNFLLECLSSIQYDYILHLAASFANQTSVEFPTKDLLVNSLGTLNMLKLCQRQRKLKKFVYFSSSCIYGDGTNEEMCEINIPNPGTPYAISKLSGEHYTNFFFRMYKLPINIVRIFNIYGSNEFPGKYRNVIPNFVYKAIRGENIPVMGDGLDIRDFTYIDDALEMIFAIMYDQTNPGETYNIGTGIETKVIDMANLIIKKHKSGSKIVFVPKRDWDHVNRRLSCSHKVNRYKQRPFISMEEGIETVFKFIWKIQDYIK